MTQNILLWLIFERSKITAEVNLVSEVVIYLYTKDRLTFENLLIMESGNGFAVWFDSRYQYGWKWGIL